MNETLIFEKTLTKQYFDEYFNNYTYTSTVENSTLNLICGLFSTDKEKITPERVVVKIDTKSIVVTARAMYFYFLNNFLSYSQYRIATAYNVCPKSVKRLIEQHLFNITQDPYIFNIHKKVYEMGEIWKETATIDGTLLLTTSGKHKNLLDKLNKKHNE